MVNSARRRGERVRLRNVSGFFSLPSGIYRQNDRRPGGRKTYNTVKRAFDIVGSAAAIFTLLPIFGLLALMVRLDSPGPVLVREVGWGRGARRIGVFMFRSTYHDQQRWAVAGGRGEGNSRLTRAGRFLRRTKLNELPQILNILKGDMSFVGPRYHPVGVLVAGRAYEELAPEYHYRHGVRPGLVSLAQLHSVPGGTSPVEQARACIACDLFYIENQSFWLDLRIMLAVLAAEFRS